MESAGGSQDHADWQGNPVPTTILQACKQVHKEILIIATTLPPVAGNCRMCLVEVGMPAMGRDRQPVLNEDGNLSFRRRITI